MPDDLLPDNFPDAVHSEISIMPTDSPVPLLTRQLVIPVIAADGARFELLCVHPESRPHQLFYWLPAMGVPARHYLPMAEALAARGIAVVIHEWRGIGSSDRRAGRRSNWGYRELLLDDLPPAIAAVVAQWPQHPLFIGGHSLGGQVASLYAALHPGEFSGIALVGSGAPYWRAYPNGVLILLGCMLAPVVANLRGYLPGRRIGFAGNEARGLTADWARSARSGCYSATGMSEDLDALLAALRLPVFALRLRNDWLAPQASLDWLLGKMPQAPRDVGVLTPDDLGGQPADHFGWMKVPQPIVERLADWLAARNTMS
jgi:predicted alpha/beta hydrolase